MIFEKSKKKGNSGGMPFLRITSNLNSFSFSVAAAKYIKSDYMLVDYDERTKILKFIPSTNTQISYKVTKTKSCCYIGSSNFIKYLIEKNNNLLNRRFYVTRNKNCIQSVLV